jgi:hypothetical protein
MLLKTGNKSNLFNHMVNYAVSTFIEGIYISD